MVALSTLDVSCGCSEYLRCETTVKTCGCTPETRVSEKGLSEKTPSREKRKSEDARIN